MNPKAIAAAAGIALAAAGAGFLAGQPKQPEQPTGADVEVTSDCRCFIKGQPDVMRHCFEAAPEKAANCPR